MCCHRFPHHYRLPALTKRRINKLPNRNAPHYILALMRFRAVLTLIAVSARLAGPPVHAAGPDDLYLDAYRLIQEGDQFAGAGQSDLARQRFSDAETNLKKIQGSYPEYNKNAVDFRLEYVRDRVKSLPGPRPAESATQPARPVSRTPADQMRELNSRISQLEGENSVLQAKLKEALAPQPAALDPREFARAQERINQLEKEKELLRASLQQAQAKQPQAADNALLDQARGELEAVKRKLVESIATVATLTQENQRLQQQIGTQKPDSAQAGALKEAQERISALDREKTAWQQERADLQSKISSASKSSGDSSRLRDIESERDALQKRLNEANRELADLRTKGTDKSTLATQLSNLRARLEVFEARKVPYTPDELALLNKDVPKLASSVQAKPAKRTVRELPAGASIIVADAERAFAARRYDEAETKYKQVLNMDEDNSVSLANLAAIQLEMQKFNEAEAHLKKALNINADDPYALSLLGMLRFQQGKFEEALDNLSRSAQLDPKNPETQNYLGITLSQQGQREAAETALRKAVSLNPNYAGAHHNLAVVYATQKPPFVELAKFHYNKALSLGQPPSADLEKQLAGAK